MAFYAIPRCLSSSTSFFPNSLEAPTLTLSLLPRLLSTTTTTTTISSVAHYCHLLRSPPSHSTLEKTLSQSTTKLNPSVINSVLHRFPSDRTSALRFFVWAGLQPNHRHSAASYSSACNSLQIPRHPQTLDQTLDAYRSDNFPVSLKTFTILLNLCRSAGLPDQALSLLRRMPEFGCYPDTPSYNAVLRLLADASRGADSAALLDEMALAGLRPDMVTYTSAVKGLCAVGRLGDARVLVSQMQANGCVPNVVVYSALLDGACRCGELDLAVSILDELEQEIVPNVVTYTCLIKCLFERGRADEALEVFDRMGRRGCSPNRVTVATLVSGLCTEGRVTDAFELVERVVREGSTPGKECYSSLVVCLLQIGMREEAERLVESMLATSVRPDGSACNSLMRKLCSQKRFLDGYRWLCKLEEEGSTCIDFDVYSILLAGLSEEGHLDESVMLGRQIVERGIRVETACADSIEVLRMNGILESLIHRIPLIQKVSDSIGSFLQYLISDMLEKVANSNVRKNALHVLLEMFPLEDPDVTKDVKDSLFEKQFFLLERLLVDECPDVRAVAVEGSCRILHLFWEVIPSSTITKFLAKVVDDMSHDLCSEVRLSTLNGIIYLLGNPQSHDVMKVLLPRLGSMFLDIALSVRVAAMDLLLAVRDIRAFQFNKVVGLDDLLSLLANDHARVAQQVTRLLIPSYFPSKLSPKEAFTRCITLIKRSPTAGAWFCEFALSEGSSSKSLMELLKVLVSVAIAPKSLNSDQIDGLFIASANISRSLLGEPSSKVALSELFSSEKLKRLLIAAVSQRARAAVLSIASIASPHNLAGFRDQFIALITNCLGLSENIETQEVVRAVHKLMVSCGWVDDLFGALTKKLQAIASGFIIQFGLKMPQKALSSLIKKNIKSKTKSSGRLPNFGVSKVEEDFAVAAAAGWQMKDLLTNADTCNAMLKSPNLEIAFCALSIISQASIEQCEHYELLDTSPLMAYTTLAIYMSLQNVGFFPEVAKESADVIILDDNLSTIAAVTKWGRSVYIKSNASNRQFIQKLQFQLTVYIKLVNMIMDNLGALVLGY